MSKSSQFKKIFTRWNRQLHLYFGLFLCPFLLIFAISTIMLNHGMRPTPSEKISTAPMPIPEEVLANVTDADVLAGQTQEQKAAANKALLNHILGALDLSGEVAGNGAVRNNQTSLFVARPGKTTRVVVDVVKQEAQIFEKSFGMFDTMRYLHLNPGPHRIPNWIATKAWGWIADTTVYLSLFLTLSGLYMWYMIRAERKTGLVFLGTGCVSFVAILWALMIA